MAFVDIELIKKALNNFNHIGTGDVRYDCGYDDCFTAVQDTISDIPTADVVEVKHGEWIEGKTLEKCSVCGKKGFPDWHYCPNCGARMDGTPKERGGEK